jgi:hypothetical protein
LFHEIAGFRTGHRIISNAFRQNSRRLIMLNKRVSTIREEYRQVQTWLPEGSELESTFISGTVLRQDTQRYSLAANRTGARQRSGGAVC